MNSDLPTWKQSDIICNKLEEKLKSQSSIYFDFMGVDIIVKNSVIRAFLTPLYDVTPAKGYKTMDPVHFANSKQDLYELYKKHSKEYDKQRCDKMIQRAVENQVNEERKFYRKRTIVA